MRILPFPELLACPISSLLRQSNLYYTSQFCNVLSLLLGNKCRQWLDTDSCSKAFPIITKYLIQYMPVFIYFSSTIYCLKEFSKSEELKLQPTIPLWWMMCWICPMVWKEITYSRNRIHLPTIPLLQIPFPNNRRDYIWMKGFDLGRISNNFHLESIQESF